MRRTRTTAREPGACQVGIHQAFRMMAMGVAVVLLALATSTMTASAAGLDPGRSAADVPATAAAKSDSLTSSDGDTIGPGPQLRDQPGLRRRLLRPEGGGQRDGWGRAARSAQHPVLRRPGLDVAGRLCGRGVLTFAATGAACDSGCY